MTINLEVAALRDRITQLEQTIAQWAQHLKLSHITPNTPSPVHEAPVVPGGVSPAGQALLDAQKVQQDAHLAAVQAAQATVQVKASV